MGLKGDKLRGEMRLMRTIFRSNSILTGTSVRVIFIYVII